MVVIFLFQFHSQVVAAFVSQYITREKPSACRKPYSYVQFHSTHLELINQYS